VLELAAVPDHRVGLGRIGTLDRELTLDGFLDRVATVLPRTGGGIRASGEADRPIRSVAVQAGAGDDLLDDARRAGADVYLTSDLRHHPAGELRAWPDAPALVDVPHWAAESLWLPVVWRLVSAGLVGAGLDVPSSVSTITTDPWNHRR
jgi:putative NIF3 family GTP cyclohydrolase 1 type 2